MDQLAATVREILEAPGNLHVTPVSQEESATVFEKVKNFKSVYPEKQANLERGIEAYFEEHRVVISRRIWPERSECGTSFRSSRSRFSRDALWSPEDLRPRTWPPSRATWTCAFLWLRSMADMPRIETSRTRFSAASTMRFSSACLPSWTSHSSLRGLGSPS
ncbi:hypothetical protein L596_020693 [Steinernema carpocapsae]|uniref:Uncharacterized protein n=1 Tax=Steinernema carpocapsae TaxID=34508 RepID=A0A4U5MUB8_STECR|nr:hypothetical protein L596_020693 [Steinernema carpocapsae]